MPHPLDKPILRDFFWCIVLPHRFKEWLAGELEYRSWVGRPTPFTEGKHRKE